MLNVVMLDMDPRELLEVYLRKPESLTLRDCKNPKRYWKPSLRGRPGIAKKISKAKALRVLVENKAWMDNPELQRLFKVINPKTAPCHLVSHSLIYTAHSLLLLC